MPLFFSGAAPSTSSVALVMMDTRMPSLDWAISRLTEKTVRSMIKRNLSVTMLTYYLNLKYALLNGYQLIFYKLLTEGCVHPRWGWRHPSYCKLCAIADAVAKGYEWVAFLDSDAFVRNATLPLPKLLRSYGAVPKADGELRGAFFGWDYPYTLGPNAGFTVLRNSPQMREMLRFWWNIYAGRFSADHSYEQHTLHWQMIHLHQYRYETQTLALRSMDPTYPHAVVHLDHNAGTRNRLWTMCLAAVELLAPRGYPKLTSTLSLLHKKPKGLPYKTREKVIYAVVKAAAVDLAQALSRGGPGGQNGAQYFLPQVIDFEASAAGVKHLKSPTPTTERLLGLPLSILNCSSEPEVAPWQQWTLVGASSSDGEAALPTRAADADPADAATSKGLQVHRLSLRGFPELCATLGETRSPRNPYASLAMLGRCKVESGSPEAARAALHYDGKTNEVRTTHTLSELRLALPEMALGCGFWPNCSGTRALRPKLCWAEIERKIDACGVTEPQMLNLMERSGRVRAVIGPGGPVAESALLRAVDDRLCLGTWRGKLDEGNAAIFMRCPDQSELEDKAPERARRRRWNGREASEWFVEPTASSSMYVRLVSKAAPQLCLSVPPLLP